MTDDEIVFDFFTVRPEAGEGEDEVKEVVPPPKPVPAFTESPGPDDTVLRTTTHSFKADPEDFAQWIKETFKT